MTSPASANTPERVIKFAMQNCGLLPDGDEPNSDQLANYMVRLNDLINFWQIKGMKLWLQEDITLSLVPGKANPYRLSPAGDVVMTKPLRVIQGYFLESTGSKRDLIPLSRDEYTRLSQVTQTGPVSQYYVDKQQSSLDVYLWFLPDDAAATGAVHLIIQHQVQNVITLNETMNFPQEWFIALHWGLSDEICTGQPQAVIDRCRGKAKEFREALEDWDVEDASTVFQPDNRMLHSKRSFS